MNQKTKSNAVPFLGIGENKKPKPTKPDFRKYKPFRNLLPRKFVTDKGEEFDVKVVKPTVACFHLLLLKADGTAYRQIKVRKTNSRLRYLVNGELKTPEEISG